MVVKTLLSILNQLDPDCIVSIGYYDSGEQENQRQLAEKVHVIFDADGKAESVILEEEA